ncbi:hypothetical protein DFH27DRAFT_369458 [Peziza echinospora]|nr:hypothetical protein DFH27DRAFT_369458 [Peziza echinospora]
MRAGPDQLKRRVLVYQTVGAIYSHPNQSRYQQFGQAGQTTAAWHSMAQAVARCHTLSCFRPPVALQSHSLGGGAAVLALARPLHPTAAACGSELRLGPAEHQVGGRPSSGIDTPAPPTANGLALEFTPRPSFGGQSRLPSPFPGTIDQARAMKPHVARFRLQLPIRLLVIRPSMVNQSKCTSITWEYFNIQALVIDIDRIDKIKVY